MRRAQDTAEKCEYSSTPGRASLVAHMVKKLSAMGETWVHPQIRQVDALEKGMANDSSILAWMEEPGGLQIGWQKV